MTDDPRRVPTTPDLSASGIPPARLPAHPFDEQLSEPGDLAAGGHGAPSLEAVLEAILLVTDEPVTSETLAEVVERPSEVVEQALRTLSQAYRLEGRGIDLRSVAGGWRLYTRADCASYVERFLVNGHQPRLTQAALETLAVIAYREPVARSRVSAIRGVNVDGVVRTLVSRGLVTESGHDPASGAVLYSTTALFLERVGLSSHAELPSLAPLLPEIDDLDNDSSSS
ncbi:MAG: SMC-Scp complex subunit ScpB [Actinomycetota bacterium]|nr:SMC-Scp complex subunit ScpB [Actinomycetota bacterium]